MVEEAGTYRPYRPSNGTEGEMFMSAWCEKCSGDTAGNPCSILTLALALQIGDMDYPGEWQYSNMGTPQCTAFTTEESKQTRCTETPDLFEG
jgi:hypothetical protein